MKRILIVIMMIVFFIGCSEEKKEEGFFLEIKTDKMEIRADNEDTVTIEAEIKDKNGNIYLNDISKIQYFMGENSLFENKFKIEKAGIYKIKAKYNNINSNEIEINAKNYLKKLIIESDKSEIKSDNQEIAVFMIKTYDQTGEEIKNIGVKLYKNGVEYTGMSFKTEIAGEYKFTAKSEGVTSNEIKIKANEPRKLKKIEIYADKTEINANNEDIARISYKTYDQYNEEIKNIGVKLYKNGVEYTGMSFKTEIAGE